MTEKRPNVFQRAAANVAVNAAIAQAAGALCGWIERENVTPEQLRAWAAANEPVITRELSTVAVGDAAWARGLFARAAAAMGPNEIWEVVRSVAGVYPEHAALFNEPQAWAWFLRQMEEAKRWLGGA